MFFIYTFLSGGIVMGDDRKINQQFTRNDFEIIYTNLINYEHLWKETLVEDNFNFDLRDILFNIRFRKIHGAFSWMYYENFERYSELHLLPYNKFEKYNINELEENDVYYLYTKDNAPIFAIMFYYKDGIFRFIDWEFYYTYMR